MRDWSIGGWLCFTETIQWTTVYVWSNLTWLAKSWWLHQMETFSALLALCAENSPVTGEFPPHRPETLGFDVFFDLRLNKRLSKQSRRRLFETPSPPLWRHCNVRSVSVSSSIRNTLNRGLHGETVDYQCYPHCKGTLLLKGLAKPVLRLEHEYAITSTKEWDVITPISSNGNGGLAKQPCKLAHGSVTTSHMKPLV